MKIISLNLAGRKDFGQDYAHRMQKIAEFLDEEKAAVVCLQEVTFSENSNLAIEVNDLMKQPYKYVSAKLAEKYRLSDSPREAKSKNLRKEVKEDAVLTDGAAIMSNIEIVKSTKITLEKVPIDERGREDYHIRIVQKVVLKNGMTISNVHFASNDNSPLHLKKVLNDANDGEIIIGDFNIFKASILQYRTLWDEKYTCSIDFLDYISFPDDSPDKQTLDYALSPKQYQFTDIRTVQGLSDHNAMIYEFEG
jgi:endonuclease/exonuclease/phosphatase family metal-dependent hydrolase